MDGTRDAYFWVDEPFWLPWETCDFEKWGWVTEAVCAGTDPGLFFDNEDGVSRKKLAAICARCPVQPACLDHAIANDEFGYWGGTTRTQRRKLMGDR